MPAPMTSPLPSLRLPRVLALARIALAALALAGCASAAKEAGESPVRAVPYGEDPGDVPADAPRVVLFPEGAPGGLAGDAEIAAALDAPREVAPGAAVALVRLEGERLLEVRPADVEAFDAGRGTGLGPGRPLGRVVLAPADPLALRDLRLAAARLGVPLLAVLRFQGRGRDRRLEALLVDVRTGSVLVATEPLAPSIEAAAAVLTKRANEPPPAGPPAR